MDINDFLIVIRRVKYIPAAVAIAVIVATPNGQIHFPVPVIILRRDLVALRPQLLRPISLRRPLYMPIQMRSIIPHTQKFLIVFPPR